MKKALILGCGPSGMIAAHAASEFGAEITIVSDTKIKSAIYGAQALYKPIPRITSAVPEGVIHALFLGEKSVYQEKIYGDPDRDSAWGLKDGILDEPIWNLHHAYNLLWDRYVGAIAIEHVTRKVLFDFIVSNEWDYIFSSIPATGLCEDRIHEFSTYEVRILRQSQQQRLFPGESNICIYNGLREDTWFKFSHYFGRNNGFEMPSWNKAEGSVLIKKPVGTNCDCWTGSITRIGRYGTWDVRTHMHDSWSIVMEVMSGEAGIRNEVRS